MAFQLRQSLILLFTAAIWGFAFVAQSMGMDYVGPFTFMFMRNIIGGTVLLPVIGLMKKLGGDREEAGGSFGEKGTERRSLLIKGGILCGIALCVASCFQQVGIQYTTVGKSGFITALYIVMVPIFSIFLGKKNRLRIWAGVLIAIAGLYFLCIDETLSISFGDLLTLLCAAFFGVQILLVDHYSPKVDGVKLACIEFYVCAVICFLPMVILEKPHPADILSAWLPILYAGALSSGVAYTLQIIGQRGMNPTVASLIMSLESVISVIAGFLILHQTMTARELFGCALMFAAILLSQLPDSRDTDEERA